MDNSLCECARCCCCRMTGLRLDGKGRRRRCRLAQYSKTSGYSVALCSAFNAQQAPGWDALFRCRLPSVLMPRHPHKLSLIFHQRITTQKGGSPHRPGSPPTHSPNFRLSPCRTGHVDEYADYRVDSWPTLRFDDDDPNRKL